MITNGGTGTVRTTMLACVCIVLHSVSTLTARGEEALVTHYAFDQDGGKTLLDRSKSGNHARIKGPSWVRSATDAALDFDADDIVDCGDPMSLRPEGAITIIVHFRSITDAQQFLVRYYAWNIYLIPGGTPILENLLDGKWVSMGAKHKVPLNEWASIGIVYDPEREIQEIYVNGQFSNSQPRTERPWVPGQHFRAKTSLGGRGFTGMIGDVRFYKRALSRDEMKAVHEETKKDPSLESSTYRFTMKPHLMFRDRKAAVQISLIGPRGGRKPEQELTGAKVEIELREKGADKVLQRQTIDDLIERKSTIVHIDLAGLKPGDYEVRTVVNDPDGKLLARDSAWISLPETPWWFNSKEGLEDIVLPPYTPLEVTHADGEPIRIRCWGRTYEFAGGPFPQQIVTAEKAILAEPVRLTAVADGQELSWTGDAVQLQQQSPTKVTMSCKVANAALELLAETTVEYDGMIRVDWKIVPRRRTSLERLVMEIPLRQEHATLQYQCRDSLFKAPGIVPPGGITRSFNPAIWLGDEERGVQWYGTSDQYWLQADKNTAIEIVQEDDRVILRLNIITSPVALAPEQDPQLSYTFALHATPIKPMPKDYWDYRWMSSHKYGEDYSMVTDELNGKNVLDYYAEIGVKSILLGNWTDAMSYPLPHGHEEDLRTLVKAIHDRGMQAIPYFGLQYSEIAPGFDAFKADIIAWEHDKPYSYPGYVDNYPGGMPTQMVYGPCIRSDWQDLMVAGAARLIDEYDVDGLYFDNASLVCGGCMNPAHPGCGPRLGLDGSDTRDFSIFEGREMMRRLYHVIKTRKPDGQLDLHMASFVTTATLAWATGNWDGETILGEDRRGASPVKGDFILNYLPLEGFRAQFMGKNWGVHTEFVDYYVPYPYEQQYALTMLHDVPIRPHISPPKLEFQARLWRALGEFGRKDAEWLPYWENSEYVTVGPEHAFVSLYKHPQNGVLAVVSNLAQATAEVTVSFNLEKLGLPADCTAVDALEDEPVSLQDGRHTVSLDSVDWQLLWLH